VPRTADRHTGRRRPFAATDAATDAVHGGGPPGMPTTPDSLRRRHVDRDQFLQLVGSVPGFRPPDGWTGCP
jgi:hypothetical protein